MNYYERYCGDYQRDTAHLSLAEHGAYTMLLDTYFSVEKPLPKEFPSLYRVCRAMTRIEQQAVKTVADQFFPVSEVDGLRHNRRADREIERARPKIEAARINGRKGGRPPKDEPGKEAGRGTRQKPGGLPEGFEKKTPPITRDVTRQEPGGKAYQHQHQHQHQHQFDKNSEDSSTQAIYPADRQERLAARSSHFSSLSPDAELVGTVEMAGESGTDAATPSGAAGACCKALIRHGVQGCNPHHPILRALLQAGAVEEEFVQAARSAASRGKTSFAYVVGTVKRQREEAVNLVLHQGRMPNKQELLEASNKAATVGWLPPELREITSPAPEIKEVQHENR